MITDDYGYSSARVCGSLSFCRSSSRVKFFLLIKMVFYYTLVVLGGKQAEGSLSLQRAGAVTSLIGNLGELELDMTYLTSCSWCAAFRGPGYQGQAV